MSIKCRGNVRTQCFLTLSIDVGLSGPSEVVDQPSSFVFYICSVLCEARKSKKAAAFLIVPRSSNRFLNLYGDVKVLLMQPVKDWPRPRDNSVQGSCEGKGCSRLLDPHPPEQGLDISFSFGVVKRQHSELNESSVVAESGYFA